MWRASSRLLVQACIGLSVALLFSACGGGGGGGGGGGSEIGALLGYKFSEGSKVAPVDLGDVQEGGVALRQKATVGVGGIGGPASATNSFYQVAGITPGVEYVVTLASPTDNVTLYLFQGDPTFTSIYATRVSGGENITFVAPADADVSSYFVSVSGSNTEKGAEYDLSVLVKPQSEGAIDDPVYLGDVVSDGLIARPGSAVAFTADCCGIQAEGDSYYVVDTEGADVLISVTNMTDNVDLYVYDDEDFTNLVCAGQKGGTAVETCLYTGSAFTLYVGIDGHRAEFGAAYRLNVIPAPIGTAYCEDDLNWVAEENLYILSVTGQTDICYMEAFPSIRDPNNSQNHTSVLPGGTLGIRPIDPFDPPAGGDVADPVSGSQDSYYWFNGLTPGNTYRLSLEDETDRAELYVYDMDASYTTPVCQPSDYTGKVQACVFEASSTVVYAAVDGYRTVRGAAFTLKLMPEFKAEGIPGTSGTPGTPPVPKDLGTAPITGSILNDEDIRTVLKDDDIGIVGDRDSYYQVTVLPDTQYFVSIPAMSDDVDLYVFSDDATFTNLVCAPYLGGTAPEQCVLTTGPAQTTMYFAVDGHFTKDGAAFLISVVSGSGGGEGTTSTPGDSPVDLGSAPVNYSGFAIGTGLEEGAFGFDPDILDDIEDSFYQVSVNMNSSYRVALENVNADVDLFVFSDPGMAEVDLICSSRAEGPVAEECIVSTTGISTLYIAVDGSWADLGTVPTYRVKVEERVLPNPDELTVGVLVANEAIAWGADYGIGGPNDRYYSADLTGPGTFRIQISNLSDDLDLYVFTDPGFQDAVSCSNTYLYGTDSEYCDYTVPSGTTTIYFGVDGRWMEGYNGTYDISVMVH